MFHVAALATVIFCAMRGASLISMPQFDAMKVWSLIIDERVSIGGAVPAILNFMRQVPQFAELNAPEFRYFLTRGAPLSAGPIQKYAAQKIEGVPGDALTRTRARGNPRLTREALREGRSA